MFVDQGVPLIGAVRKSDLKAFRKEGGTNTQDIISLTMDQWEVSTVPFLLCITNVKHTVIPWLHKKTEPAICQKPVSCLILSEVSLTISKDSKFAFLILDFL